MNQFAKSLCDFLDASPTAYHAADNIAAALLAHGAVRLDEGQEWKLEPGASYFVERGGVSAIAFRPGLKRPGEGGFTLAGAHTDSPCLKLRTEKPLDEGGIARIPVEMYGSAILSGWLDRPLACAGKVYICRDGETRELLYNSGAGIGVIPNLAIHLNREINKGFEYNIHKHMPVFVDVDGAAAPEGKKAPQPWILRKVGEDLGIDPADITGADLSLYDFQKAFAFGRGASASGGGGESSPEGALLNSPRLDDLAGCHAVLEAFCGEKAAVATQVAVFLEAEEIGSMTAQGADSSFLRDILARINHSMGGGAEDFYRAIPKSICLSLDAAQAIHPAYPEKADEMYSPKLGKGPVVKVSANRRYATDARAEAVFAAACRKAGTPWQKYMARADIQPGTTIGPISASRLGMLTIDIGHPLLSMHAVRETIHSSDHSNMISLLRTFFAG